MSALAMPWDSGKTAASVLWCSGFIECLGESCDRGVELGLKDCSMLCSRLLSSAAVEVSDEPTCEAIALEVFV